MCCRSTGTWSGTSSTSSTGKRSGGPSGRWTGARSSPTSPRAWGGGAKGNNPTTPPRKKKTPTREKKTTYTALLHNNDTEYIVFEGDGAATATATTRTRTRSPYSDNNPAEVTVNQPDYLFSSYADEFLIEEIDEWVDGEEERIIEVDVPMHPVVFSYIIRFEFESGKEYINEARGALSGMAGTVNLSDRRTLDDVVTVLYEEAEVSDYGVEAVVRSFGLCNFDPVPTDEYPDGHFYTPDETTAGDTQARSDRPKADEQMRHILTLELALKSGQVKTFEVDVTDRMREQPRGGVLLIQGLEVTPEEGEGNQTGGFEVSVDDWGNSEDIDLPL